MKKKDSYNYKGWLTSDDFFTRSLATFGHSIVGQLIVLAALCIAFTIVLLFIMLFERLTGIAL